MEEDKKPWYASVTLWGAFLLLVGQGLQFAGIELTIKEQQSLAEYLATVGTIMSEVVGLVLVVYGRIRAKVRIG